MGVYNLDERSVVGHDEIDAEHLEIAQLSSQLTELFESGAGFRAVRNAFDSLAATLLEHLKTEEKLLAPLRDQPGVADHLARHRENHDTIRMAISYAKDKFAEKEATGEIPNITTVLPDHYFQQMRTMDAEMVAVLKNLDKKT